MPKILSIQYLRAAAALMVVFFHADGMALEYFHSGWPSFGAAGVDMFFVVSGFIMWITAASEQTTPASFVVNRIIRVVPLYWAMTLLLYVGWLMFRDTASLPPVWNLVRSLLFIPFVSLRTGDIQPLLIAGWTLDFEIFFYVVFACGLLLARQHRALFLCTILGGLVALPLFVTPSGAAALTYTSPLLIEFVMGCLLGVAYERDAQPRPVVAAFLLAIGSGLLLTSNTLPATNLAAARFFDWGLPAFLIVTGALGLEPILKEWRLPMLLGDASYSIYLTHSAALAMLKTIVLMLGASGGLVVTATFVIAGCIMSVLAGIVVFHAVEKPLVARCKVLAMSLRRTPLVAAGRIF